MGFFPYEPRPFQEEAVALVRETAAKGGHLALEAPTGTGKTVILLAGALESALASGRRILYVTRTNSQQEQAVRELGAIATSAGRTIRGLALQGRQRLCLKLEDADDPDLEESSPEDLSHFCRNAKRATDSGPQSERACTYYAGLLSRNDEDLEREVGSAPVTAEALKALGRTHGFCSYEATKRLLPAADVVIAPYVFAFDQALRTRLFEWWQTAPENVVLVVDEAHNLPSFLREMHSPRLTREALRRALSESESLGHPMIGPELSTRALLESLALAIDRIVNEFAKEDDGFIPPYELEEELLSRFRVPSTQLIKAAHAMSQLGEIIRDRKRLLGKVPKSALAHVAAFLRHWFDHDETAGVKLALRTPRPALETFRVDVTGPAQCLAEFHASVHASGTLAPLAEYRDTLGLGEDARLERFPSPFEADRLVVRVTKGLTTRFESMKTDPGLVDRLQEAVRAFVARTTVNSALFFPSHQMLAEFREVGALGPEGSRLLVESRDLSQDGVMELVKRHRAAASGSLLVGVVGGRLSEGMDFPGRQLEALCLVGAPFPKPTARQRSLFRYYDAHGGKGWDYAVRAPAIRRIRQTLGRVIRGPEDRGFVVILDERAAPLLEESGVEARTDDPEAIWAEYSAWQGAPRDDIVKRTP